MAAIILIIVCLVLGEMLTPSNRRNRYRRRNRYDRHNRYYDDDYDDDYDDEIDRRAGRYTLVFMALVCLALYFFNAYSSPETGVATR
jgi:hypothetical protein